MVEQIIMVLMAKNLDDLGIFDKMTEAKLTGNKELALEAAKETEKVALAVAYEVTKPDAELYEIHGESAVEAKREFEQGLVVHNYKFLDLETPFENGVTLEELKGRNGYATDGTPFTDEAIAFAKEVSIDI